MSRQPRRLARFRKTMELEDTLLAIEEQLWKGDADFYVRALTEDALMVFPAPAGLLDKAQVVRSIATSQRWQEVSFHGCHLLQPAPGIAILTYRVSARRKGQETRYVALASTVYVQRAEEWELAFHQQTPLATAQG
jgi:hypothetical protein